MYVCVVYVCVCVLYVCVCVCKETGRMTDNWVIELSPSYTHTHTHTTRTHARTHAHIDTRLCGLRKNGQMSYFLNLPSCLLLTRSRHTLTHARMYVAYNTYTLRMCKNGYKSYFLNSFFLSISHTHTPHHTLTDTFVCVVQHVHF